MLPYVHRQYELLGTSFQCCFTSTETERTFRDEFSVLLYAHRDPVNV